MSDEEYARNQQRSNLRWLTGFLLFGCVGAVVNTELIWFFAFAGGLFLAHYGTEGARWQAIPDLFLFFALAGAGVSAFISVVTGIFFVARLIH